MTQRHYDIYVESVWNCASSKACSSVYLLDRGIPLPTIIQYGSAVTAIRP